MEQTHSHRTKIKRISKPPKGFGRYINSTLISVFGSIFLLIGLYSTFSSLLGPNGINGLISGFIAPSTVVPVVIEISGGGLQDLIFWLLPPILLLISSLFYTKKYHKITLPISVITAGYLFIMQIMLFLNYITKGGGYFSSLIIAGIFLTITVLLLFLAALWNKKLPLLILTCCYFYASIVLYSAVYGTPYNFLFPGVIVFSLLIFILGQKTDHPIINSINLLFAILYWSLFWFRNFIVNAKTGLLFQFFVLALLFYFLFTVISIIASAKKEHPIPRQVQLGFAGLNLLIFAGTPFYVLVKYITSGYIGLYVALMLLIQVIGLYFIKKTKKEVWLLPFHYSLILLISVALPLMLNEYRIIIFTSVLSVLMIGYANRYKQQSAFWISLFSQVMLVVYFLYAWVRTCLPLLLDNNALPARELQLYGLLIGLAISGTFGLITKELQKSQLELSHDWFSKRKYDKIVRSILYFSIFLTMGWLMFIVAFQLTGSASYTTVAWFISGSLFFIGAIRYYVGRKSSFKKPALYTSLAFALLFPPLVHWNMVIYRTGLMMMHPLNGEVILLHYTALALIVILGKMIIRRIYLQEYKNMYIKQSLEIFTIFFILFLLFTEYDNLIVILGRLQNNPNSPGLANADMLMRNIYLPYSLIIWVVTVAAFIRSILRNHPILRNFTIVLYISMVVKIFMFDFETLSTGARSAVFLILGLFLVGFALIYPKLLRGKKLMPEFKRGVSKSKHNS